MSSFSGFKFMFLGFMVHLVLFYSIFDIYFTSPLVHGMSPHSASLPAPARRLVLFSADGLRADKLFEIDSLNTTRAPYLRHVITNAGAWGVSHTHMPTESRPGHVAMIAGFYEDVSAVAKGWKENPVEFDSVFNESRFTWSWGSPDILPMFSKGATGDHVFTEMYPSEFEDFAAANASHLDFWVFKKVRGFFEKIKQNETLSNVVKQDRTVFFLHLLGLDTNGHSHKPNSEEYLTNIKVLDHGIEDVVALFNDYFADVATAFVMTSDHGMTDWGSHGSGDPSETLTPLVAWGAGVRSAQKVAPSAIPDHFTREWQLEEVKRSDVNQADISCLMAALLGLNFPLNSVGTVPLDYLDVSERHKAHSIRANAKQMLAQYQVKMLEKKKTTFKLLFRPFDKLTARSSQERLLEVNSLIAAEDYQHAISKSHEIISLSLDGLMYYHNYDRLLLGCGIFLSFVLWMTYVFVLIIESSTRIWRRRDHFETENSQKAISLASLVSAGVVVLLLYVQNLPFTYYLYNLMPVLLVYLILLRRHILINAYFYMIDHNLCSIVFFRLLIAAAGLMLIVFSFDFREILSVAFLGMAIQPWFSASLSSKPPLLLYSAACVIMAVFPLLPVVGRSTNYSFVVAAGFVLMLLLVLSSIRLFGSSSRKLHSRIPAIQMFVLAASVGIVLSTASAVGRKSAVAATSQAASWAILVGSMMIPLFSPTLAMSRLLSVSAALSAPYILLSISHEVFFVIALLCLLASWLGLEHSNTTLQKHHKSMWVLDFASHIQLGEQQRLLELADIQRAFVFIFLLIVSFFGTGNIASVNSFEPASVYCFITVFNPHVMGLLMLIKILIPFLLVTCFFNCIHLLVNVPERSLYLLVLVMSDFLALNFFFRIKNFGSWLDIGQSISHYVIVMSMISFLFLLLTLGRLITTIKLNCNCIWQFGTIF